MNEFKEKYRINTKREVVVTANSNVVLSIEREEEVCGFAIQESKKRCKILEERYKLPSEEFYKQFQEGKFGDDEDFFEWKALIDGIHEWQKTKEGLINLMKK